MIEYYIHDGQKELGPFTLIQLTSQNINHQTPVWHKGLSSWTTAGALEELEPMLASKASPPPFNVQQTAPPPFIQTSDSGAKGSSKTYLIAGFILIIGSLFWYVSASDIKPTSPEDGYPIDSVAAMSDEEIERQRINVEITAKNTNYRNNWERFIWAKNDKYKYNLLGGITDLEVVVTNETEYILDEVIVSVQYIKDNGAIYKTEAVTVYNVPAQGKASMPAPDSDRGTSVKMEIGAISSKKMHFCYSSDIDARGSEDPYFCRAQ